MVDIFVTSKGIKCGIMIIPKPMQITGQEAKLQNAMLPDFIKRFKERNRAQLS